MAGGGGIGGRMAVGYWRGVTIVRVRGRNESFS